MTIRNSRGSLIFPMVIALMIMIFSIFYFYHNAFMVRKVEDQRLLSVGGLKALVVSTKALLNSPHAFMTSAQLTSNGSFWNCLNNPNFNCNVSTEQDFNLLNEDGTLYVDMTAGRGYTPTFESCDSYPSLACPFRYELKWFRECVGPGACYSPDLFIRGQLVIANIGGLKNLINPESYDFLVKVR
ncbi:MAG: hypothetical protein AAGB31_01105 [Bdellovibrio sp.]